MKGLISIMVGVAGFGGLMVVRASMEDTALRAFVSATAFVLLAGCIALLCRMVRVLKCLIISILCTKGRLVDRQIGRLMI